MTKSVEKKAKNTIFSPFSSFLGKKEFSLKFYSYQVSLCYAQGRTDRQA